MQLKFHSRPKHTKGFDVGLWSKRRILIIASFKQRVELQLHSDVVIRDLQRSRFEVEFKKFFHTRKT